MRTRSPGSAPAAATIRSSRSWPTNFTIGERAPSASTATWTRPLAPNRRAALDELVDLAPRRAAETGGDDRLDPAAGHERVVEDREAGRRPTRIVDERGGQVDELEPEPQVGLVGSVPFDDLVEGEPRERHLEERPVRGGRRGDLDGHRLDEAHHGLLVDEAHLEIELGELGLAVPAQVLVPEAPGDLVVAIDPGDHQQLLELLRALRQGVDRPRLETARDDEVAGALGRGLDQVRGLHLDEAVGVMDPVDRLDEARAQEQPLLHRLPPDVEVAVAQPERLVDRGVGLIDVERRGLRLGQDLDRRGAQLDVAGRQLRVLLAGLAPVDRAVDREDVLAPDPTRQRMGRRRVGRIDHDLGDPVAVAQVEEDQLAVIAPTVDPARQAGGRPGVGRPELAAGVTAIRAGERGGGRLVESWPAYRRRRVPRRRRTGPRVG